MNAQDWFNCVQVLDSEGEANESWVTAIRLVYPTIETELSESQSLFVKTWLARYSVKVEPVNETLNETWAEVWRLFKLWIGGQRRGTMHLLKAILAHFRW